MGRKIWILPSAARGVLWHDERYHNVICGEPMIRTLISMQSIVFLILLSISAWAADRSEGPPGVYADNLACRIVSRVPGAPEPPSVLVDSSLKTVSGADADRTIAARLPTGKVLSATVKHVYVKLPRDRFNVAMFLDGRPHVRFNHMDLDIFAEATIDGHAYALHCFADTVLR